MPFTVTLLGVGEAYDAHEANSAALVEARGFTLLIDCGHSAVPAIWRRCADPDMIDAIYLTHHHADHVLGLLPVAERWISQRRRRALTILTTRSGIDHLHRLFAAGSIPLDGTAPYPIILRTAADTAQLGPCALAVAPTRHAVPNHAIRLELEGSRFAYSGDGRPTEQALALYADADLLVHECYVPEQSDLPYHCDLPTVRAIAGPPRIGLCHIRAGDREAMKARIAGDPRLFVPEAGTRLTL